MTQYKEFQGKSLDEAIGEACAYYGVPREKLEIDILNDAKGGIFGLMGMKKACIRAARTQLGEVGASLLEEEKRDEKAEKAPRKSAPKTEDKKSRPQGSGRSKTGAADEAASLGQKKSPEKTPPRSLPRPPKSETADAPLRQPKAVAGQDRKRPEAAGAASGPATKPAQPAQPAIPALSASSAPVAGGRTPDKGQSCAPPDAEDEGPRDGLPEFDLENGDLDLMRRTVSEVVLRLARPIVGDSACEARISGKRVRAVLECGEAAGLLVGRDGQTLAALQYLASRIIARQLGASVHLHIDAGHYRERQDDKLRELALSLAEKARQSGRAQSTRPLSAYQRRLIHLALENDPQVYTRSKGDGAQRRVIILLKRARPGGSGPETAPESGAQPGLEVQDSDSGPESKLEAGRSDTESGTALSTDRNLETATDKSAEH